MRLLIRRAGHSETHELDVDTCTTVCKLKEMLPTEFRCSRAVDDMHLVWGGGVLCDNVKLLELALEPSATLVLLVDPVPSPIDWFEAAVALGLLPQGCNEPPKLQSGHGPKYAQLLNSFLASLKDSATPWSPSSSEEWEALRSAISALTTTSPAFKAAPHVTWFCEYGCALLASVPRVGEVHLQLVGLDDFKFRMHSEPTRRTHTADAYGWEALHVGRIALELYPAFMCEVQSERHACERLDTHFAIPRHRDRAQELPCPRQRTRWHCPSRLASCC
jgi:hypothetical protein